MLENNTVGIEVGSNSIKIVYGSFNGKRISIKDYRILDTPDNAILPNHCINIDALTPKISTAITDMKCRRKNCFVSLSSTKTIVRERRLPKVKPKEMNSLVRYEAEQFLPYDINDFSVDYKIIGEVNENDLKMFKVLIAAVPLDIIYSYMELIKACKLKIKGIDVFTNSIYKYARTFLLEEGKNVLLVDIGGKYTKSIIFSGKEYYANINSDIGGRDATEGISHTMNLDIDASEELKCTKGNLNYSSKEEVDNNLFMLTNSLKSTYNEILNEITRVMDFFRSRQYGTHIENLFILGGGGNLKGVENYFGTNLGIKVKILTPSDNVKIISELDIKDEDYRRIIPAIGSIIRGV